MKNIFKVTENGKEIEYEIVKISKFNNNSYIIYKDNENYYAARYNIIGDKIQLDEILDENEWDFIDEELNTINE